MTSNDQPKRILFFFLKPILTLAGLGLLYLLYLKLFNLGIPCVFRKLTGYQCPGCGMTHAMLALWDGDFDAALQYNALSITVLPIICLYLGYRYWISECKASDHFRLWEFVLLIILFIVVTGYGVIRNVL